MLVDPVGVVVSRLPYMAGGGAWVGESGGALSSSTHTSTNAEARAFDGAIGCRELGLMLMKEL